MVKKKKEKSFVGRLKEKVVSKRILKKSQVTLTIQKKEYPSILGDTNRFFKDEYEETKRSLFFK